MRAFSMVQTSDGLHASTGAGYLQTNAVTGIVYDDYNYKDPMSQGAKLNPPALTASYMQGMVDQNMYRIFYPATDSEEVLKNRASNPWMGKNYKPGMGCAA